MSPFGEPLQGLPLWRLAAVLLLGLSATGAVAQDEEEEKDAGPPQVQGAIDVPLWQLQAFDRLTIGEDEYRKTYDVVPQRLPQEPKGFEPTADEYIGAMGLPPDVSDVFNEMLYEIRLTEDQLKYRVYGKHITEIVQYESLLLDRALRLIDQKDYDDAFAYLQRVEERDPDWPGYRAAQVLFHAGQAEQRRFAGDYRQALVSLQEEIRQRALLPTRDDAFDESKYPESLRPQFGDGTLPAQWRIGVAAGAGKDRGKPNERDLDTGLRPPRQQFEEAVGSWLTDLFGSRRWEEGRRAVAFAETIFPDGAQTAAYRKRFAQATAEALETFRRRREAGDLPAAYEALLSAIDVQPDFPGLRQRVADFAAEYGVLRVGVPQVAEYRQPPVRWTPADIRCSPLWNLPVMYLKEPARAGGDDVGTFASDVVADLEKAEINKRAIVTLKDGLRWPQDGKPVTATDLQRLLAATVTEDSGLYHPAFARLLQSMSAPTPGRLELEFDRPQFQPASWLQMPFMRVSGEDSVLRFRYLPATRLAGLGPFALTDRNGTGQRPEFVRFTANESFAAESRPAVRQLDEISYATSADRLRALEEGEIDLVAQVPPRHFDEVATMPGARLGVLEQPTMTVLQFNYDRPELRSNELRRAIAFAIDRERIMAALELPVDEDNHPADSVLPTRAFGYTPAFGKWPHDPLLSLMLLKTYRRTSKVVPPLRIVYAGAETTRRVAELVAADLEKVGFEVTVIDDTDGTASRGAASLVLQSYSVADPIHDLITLLLRDNPSMNRHASPWLRLELVKLVEVPNLAYVQRLVPQVQRWLERDAALVPLFEWRDRYAAHEALTMPEQATGSLYETVGQWRVEPRFPEVHWQTRE